ncbi:hypothetical protein Patl1_06951 [Pistacia atlantica]|uniref:Uncharacterized protein n=1 Tax=Pistacia atlantica TaxID=434234 RepID=A0ACC1AGU1_9ROSI|nr:hypothetical protein Patl1_06951 [Pistacia atlantica]
MSSLILSGPFAVIDEHFNLILPNCYDAIGLMLMIRIIHQHQLMLQALVIAVFMSHHVSAADPLLGFIFRQGLLSFMVFDLYLGSLCNANVRTLWEDDIHHHYVMRCYAEFTASLVHLNVEYGDGQVELNMERLRMAVDELLMKLAEMFPRPKLQIVFLINNYDMTIAVLKEASPEGGKIQMHFEELLKSNTALLVVGFDLFLSVSLSVCNAISNVLSKWKRNIFGCWLCGSGGCKRSCWFVVDMIRQKKMAGCALLLAVPPVSFLHFDVPNRNILFLFHFVGSEVYSSEVKKTEVLMENFRRAIGLRIKENEEVYEGEVTELSPEETESVTGGCGKSISHVIIGLKTVKGTKQLKLEPSIYDALIKEKVAVGDVIYIEANSGAVKRVGRSDAFAAEFDLEAEEYVPLPKGEVHKKKEIDQVHMLDMECFSYLIRALESSLSPIVILATNRGICNVSYDTSCADIENVRIVIPTFS